MRYWQVAALTVWLTVTGTNMSGAEERGHQVRRLSELPRACIQRQDTGHPLFSGCIDWHSAVHAHWALIYAAHTLQTSEEIVRKRLQPGLIAEELAQLRSGDIRQEFFERPYGRAWFLQLARDDEQFFANSSLHAAAEYIYSTLLDYARAGGGEILSPEYDNACWYLYQLDQWARHTGKDADRQLIKDLAIQRLRAIRFWPDFYDIRGFFAPKSLALLLAHSVGDQEQLQRLERAIKAESLAPLAMPFATAHQGGLNYSRAWGLWTLFQVTGNPEYRQAYEAHLRYMDENRAQWQGDYRRYGHWVAQFGLFAFRLADSP